MERAVLLSRALPSLGLWVLLLRGFDTRRNGTSVSL
jgi:hypothetical protein